MCLLVEYHSYRITHDMQERITLKVDLAPEVTDDLAHLIQLQIEAMPEVKHVDYISKEKAAEIFTEDLNDDFVSFIGYNPLYPSMMVNLKANYIPDVRQEGRSEGIRKFTETVGNMEYVTGVTYQENVVNELNDVFYKITWFLIIFMGLLIIVSILLISSTIRIALYAQRNTIRTMQLVGAKSGFIARPFVGRSIWYGLLGALITILILAVALGAINQSFTGLELLDQSHLVWYGSIAVIIIILGIFLSYMSTIFAVHRYLRNNK
jgi:cell division transport system permease protein